MNKYKFSFSTCWIVWSSLRYYDNESYLVNIEKGVPQGSILRPLFCLYSLIIFSLLMCLYADDKLFKHQNEWNSSLTFDSVPGCFVNKRKSYSLFLGTKQRQKDPQTYFVFVLLVLLLEKKIYQDLDVVYRSKCSFILNARKTFPPVSLSADIVCYIFYQVPSFSFESECLRFMQINLEFSIAYSSLECTNVRRKLGWWLIFKCIN